MTTNLITYVEVTDTFGGEANYAWCKRHEIRGLEGKSDLAVVRHVKKLIGWTGIRCRTTPIGDDIELRPAGLNQICFISFHTYGSAS